MESENIEEINQEGGQGIVNLNASSQVVFYSGSGTELYRKTLQTIWNKANQFDSLLSGTLANFSVGGQSYNDRPLLLSDLASLIVPAGGAPRSVAVRPNIQTLFDSVPLAQYKHLPDDTYFMGGGSRIDEKTLDSQEVSLPSKEETEEVPLASNEEVMPSLDIIEPSSTGGSYKRSSHKKRKSTRIRTKKNKKL